MFENIHLLEHQQELLTRMVEDTRAVSPTQRGDFPVVAMDHQRELELWLATPPKAHIPVSRNDLEVLHQAGLIVLRSDTRGIGGCYVTPQGFAYYDYMKQPKQFTTAQQLQRVLGVIRDFQAKHPGSLTADTLIAEQLDLPIEDVRAYMDELVERGLTLPGNSFDGHAAYLQGKGRLALNDPNYFSPSTSHGTTIQAYYDQRHQNVTYQYNAAGNINFGAVHNPMELIGELEKLKGEITRAGTARVLDAEVVTDAEYQVTKAIQQAQKPAADKRRILEHLDTAKELIGNVTAAAGMVEALVKAGELVQQLFT